MMFRNFFRRRKIIFIFGCNCSKFIWFSFRWEGEGPNEVGKDKKTGEIRVAVNPKFYRPTEVVSRLKFVKETDFATTRCIIYWKISQWCFNLIKISCLLASYNYWVMSKFIFSIHQSAISLLNLRVWKSSTCQELLSDWSIYWTVKDEWKVTWHWTDKDEWKVTWHWTVKDEWPVTWHWTVKDEWKVTWHWTVKDEWKVAWHWTVKDEWKVTWHDPKQCF